MNFPTNWPIVYSGDPGVRNPYLNQGYITGAISPPPVQPLNGAGTPTVQPTMPTPPPYLIYVPNTSSPPAVTNVDLIATDGYNLMMAGMPLPTNVAFPGAVTMPTPTSPTLDSVMMPPPIPPARLFQVPDAYGAGACRTWATWGSIIRGLEAFLRP